MDTSDCPPQDVWEDYHHRTLLPEEQAALQEHLVACEDCRERYAKKPAPLRDWSMVLATIATAIFGVLGLTLVLVVSFRQPPPERQPAPAVQPSPNTLTISEPTSVSSTLAPSFSDASGE